MQSQTIIAYFDERADAAAAREALAEAGLADAALAILPEEDNPYQRYASVTAYDHRKDEGGFWAALARLLMPDQKRYAYAEGMSRGGVMLTAEVGIADRISIIDLLEARGSVDITQREEAWRSEGWKGLEAAVVGPDYDATAWPADTMPPGGAGTSAGGRSFPPSRTR